MAYIIERNTRFYVVAYDGIDPLTGRERRRWHPAGRSRADAEAIATTLDANTLPPPDVAASPLTFCKFLSEQWMPRRRPQLGASTTHRYQWMVDNYINPRIGDIPIRALRVEHIDQLYRELLEHGSRTGGALASKTVYDVHVIIRSTSPRRSDGYRRAAARVTWNSSHAALLLKIGRGAGRLDRTKGLPRVDAHCADDVLGPAQCSWLQNQSSR